LWEGVMSLRIGYLLPTREQIMEGRPQAAPLLALAERAEGLAMEWRITLGSGLIDQSRKITVAATHLAEKNVGAARSKRIAM